MDATPLLLVTAAIFGLIGVIVGGLLNGFVSALAERRRDQREARAAARLLERELRSAQHGVCHWLERRNGGEPARDDALRFPAWKQYHSIAARTLPTSDWDAVSDAYLSLYVIRTGDEFGAQLGDRELAHLEATDKSIATALVRLRVHAEQDLGWRRILRRPRRELAPAPPAHSA